MHNTIKYTMTEIFAKIPNELLNLAFTDPRQIPKLSLTDNIYEKVLKHRVMPRCNLNGGKSKEFVLQQAWHEHTPMEQGDNITNAGYFAVYRVPPEARDHLPLVDVTSVLYPRFLEDNGHYGSIHDTGGITLMQTTEQMLSSHDNHRAYVTPNIDIRSGDLIVFDPPMNVHIDWRVTCKVAYDEQMNNLNAQAVEDFAKLCVEATKAFIHNELIIKIEMGYVRGGAEIGQIKNIIDKYEEADQRYEELVTGFSGGARLDRSTMSDLLPYLL